MPEKKQSQYSYIFQYGVALIYFASAIMKLIDFDATAIMLNDIVHIDPVVIKTALFVLILVEASLALMLVLNLFKKFIRNSIVIISVLFIAFNLLLIVYNYDNCGCFGATVKQSPYISIIKNIAIILMIIRS